MQLVGYMQPVSTSIGFSPNPKYRINPPINGNNLSGHVVIFKAFDVVLAASYSFCFLRIHGHKECSCHATHVIRFHIKAVRTARFLQTTALGSHNRQATLYGFDDWNTETFVTRWVNKGLCLTVNGWQKGVGNTLQEVDTLCQTKFFDGCIELFLIARLPSHDDKMKFLGKL